MVTLTRAVRFAAAHRYEVAELPPEENERRFGKCYRPHGHGHNYRVEVTVGGPLDPVTGMVVDLAWLDRVLTEEVVEPLDHSFLNYDVPEIAGRVPTTENVALVLWRRLSARIDDPGGRRLVRVRVHEDETLSAECDGDEARR